MKFSPRIVVPAGAALVTAVVIGLTFLWQIQTSVRTIESGFTRDKTTMKTNLVTPLLRQTGTLAAAEPSSKALTLLQRGQREEEQGNGKQAEAFYTQSVNADGGIAALRKLAGIQIQRREFGAARSTIETLKRQGGDPGSSILLEGTMALHAGNRAEAARVFGDAQERAEGQYGLALLAIADGKHDDAKSHLQAVIKGSSIPLRSSASILIGAYDAYALFPESPSTHLQTLLGRALAQVGECETALPLLDAVVSTQDTYRDAWLVRGFCQFSTERYTDALGSLERAYNLDAQKPEIQYFLARTHEALGDTQNAITFLQYAIVNGFPAQREARQLLASYAQESNNPSLALDAYLAITQQADATFTDTQTYVDMALRTPGSENDGYLVAEKALKKWPDEPAALIMAAQAAMVTNRIDEAKKDVRDALALDPSNASARDLQQKLDAQVVPSN